MALTIRAANNEFFRLSQQPAAQGTIMFWFRFNSETGSIQRPFSAADDFELRTSGTTAPFNFIADVLGTGGTGSTSLSLNVWYHVAVTWDETSNQSIVYIDGAVDNTNFFQFTNGPFGLINMGTRFDESDDFDGSYQDVRLYDRVLSQAEIQTVVAARGHDDILNGMVLRHTFQEKNPGRNATPYKAQASADNFGTSITVNVPQHSNGDLLVAIIACSDTSSFTTPTGWTKANVGIESNGSTGCHIYYRTANNEPASYTFTSGVGNTNIGVIISYDGTQFNTKVPQTVPVATSDGNSTTPVAPSATATQRSLVINVFHADDNDSIVGVPGDNASVRFGLSEDNGGGNGVTLGISDRVLPEGVTGDATWTLDAAEAWRGYTIIFNGPKMSIQDISNNGNHARPIGESIYAEGTLSLRKRR